MAPTILGVLQDPGIQRIFLHDYVGIDVPTLRSMEGWGTSRYTERALMMAQRGDIVAVLDPLDPKYLCYLDELGVGPGADGVVALDASPELLTTSPRSLLARLAVDGDAISRVAERMDRTREAKLNPYFGSPVVAAVRSRLENCAGREIIVEAGSVGATDLANRKDRVREAAQVLHVPIPDGEVCGWSSPDVDCVESAHALVEAIARHIASTGSVMIRGAWSMHGVDNLTIANGHLDVDGVRQWLAQRRHLCTYLVETRVPLVASPNLQLWISDDGRRVMHLATTNQRLDAGSAYHGSEFPHRKGLEGDLITSALTLGRWLSSMGYRGPLGIDFIETIDRESGKGIHLLAEINGRINGATYAIALGERLNQVRAATNRSPISAWVTNTALEVRARSFSELYDLLGDLVYTHALSCGVVPYNTGLLPRGQVHLAILATTVEGAKALERELIARVGTT